LLELREYASEVDVEFVRKAIRAISRVAIKFDRAAEPAISVLLELIQTKVNYVVQEAVVVVKDVFRRYPGRYESIVSTLCENLETLDQPDAKASMIWILGEYADRIEGVEELLGNFLTNFHEENSQVRCVLITSIVKLFLKSPQKNQEMVTKILNLCTEEAEDPDLRDRGFVYWRLLSANPQVARAVVLAERPLISNQHDRLSNDVLDQLMENLGTLSAMYNQLPSTFGRYWCNVPCASS